MFSSTDWLRTVPSRFLRTTEGDRYSNEQMPTYRSIVTLRVTFLKADIFLISSR